MRVRFEFELVTPDKLENPIEFFIEQWSQTPSSDDGDFLDESTLKCTVVNKDEVPPVQEEEDDIVYQDEKEE